MEAKNARVAFALLCGLAICCSVMYITTDGEEVVLAAAAKIEPADPYVGAGFDLAYPRVNAGWHDKLTAEKNKAGAVPRSVESVDVKKAGTIITDTPDGRMRLRSYLDKVEELIMREVQSRRQDIAAIRVKMAKNEAYNAKARSEMKKMLLAKMAENAKIAHQNLEQQIQKTQAEFAHQAQVNNARYQADIAHSQKTREIMSKNKAEAAKNLHLAVESQQAQLFALKSATNAKIHSTEKSIAVNAAQIKENAKAAKAALESAMDKFNSQMANVQAAAAKGRSELAAQAASQDKAFRNDANNQIRTMIAQTAEKFAAVKKKMAEDRAEVDANVKNMASQVNAALAAHTALADQRFQKTVKDIAEAKKEAQARLDKAESQFKSSLLSLDHTVAQQVSEVKDAQAKLSHTIANNRLKQAEIDHHVDAEMGRMLKLGNERYAEHLKKDKELHALLEKNQESIKHSMRRMADEFNEGLDKIKKEMQKDREHQSNALKTASDKLYATMAANMKAQGEVDAKLAAATKQAAKDAKDALEAAKLEWSNKLAGMHSICVQTAKRQQAKIDDLTKTVREDALKDAEGRKELKKQQKANKAEIESAISNAINQGESRALAIETKQKDMTDKMRANLNNKIDAEVSALRVQTQKSLYTLSLDTDAARAMMRKEVEAALQDAKNKARNGLQETLQWATGKFAALDELLGTKKGAAKEVASETALVQKKLQEAVDKLARAVLALDNEVNREIKKNNKSLTVHAELLAANAKKASDELKGGIAALTDKIHAAQQAAKSSIAAVGAGAMKRYESALASVVKGLADAETNANAKFSGLYAKMAQQRSEYDTKYSQSIRALNDALAQQAALENEQFTKQLPEKIAKLRTDSAARVDLARKSMTTSIVALVSVIKQQETKVQGDIAVVSGQVISNEAAQVRVNAKVAEELQAIEAGSNENHSVENRFSKEIKIKVDANKAAAAVEVNNLAKKTQMELASTRGAMADARQQAAIQLTESTKKLYHAFAAHESDQDAAKALAGAKAGTAGNLESAKQQFAAKVNTLTNFITFENEKYEEKLKELTGVAHDWNAVSVAEHVLLQEQTFSMSMDLNKALLRAIQLGEAQAKSIEDEKLIGTELAAQTMTQTIAETIETMSDEVFSLVQDNRKVIADNYISIKAYAIASKDALEDYNTKGKGRNLASVGDLLTSIGELADAAIGKAEGLGAGSNSIPLLFSGNTITVKEPINQINFLVGEFTKMLTAVQSRWPSGLGKYLLARIEANMQKTGILEVDHIEGKSGNFVFVNAHAVGLSSKLSDFEHLAVKMDTYQAVLAELTKKAATPAKGVAGAPAKGEQEIYVPPPEWNGK